MRVRWRARSGAAWAGTLVAGLVLLVGACGPAEPAGEAESGGGATFQKPATAEGLQERVRTRLDALDAVTSLYAEHLPTGRTVAVRADQPMNTLSVIKLPIMALAFRDAEAGRLDLDGRHTVRPEEMRGGSGLLQTFQPGLQPTWRDLVTQMIITSDNTATDIVIARLGMDRVNGLLREREYRETALRMTTGEIFKELWVRADPAHDTLSDRQVFEAGFSGAPGGPELRFEMEGDSTVWLGRSTARETTRLLKEIHGAELTSEAHAGEMVRILRRQFYRSRLPRYVRSQGVTVAHKTGDWPPVGGNDVGILFYEGGPTVVVAFTNQNRGDFDAVEATLGRIAQDLVQAWR